jgi:hypothetical protein
MVKILGVDLFIAQIDMNPGGVVGGFEWLAIRANFRSDAHKLVLVGPGIKLRSDNLSFCPSRKLNLAGN